MSLLWFLLIGLIAGALAKWIMPGKDPGGLIITMLLGVAGAYVGGFLFDMIGIGQGGPAGLIGAVVGAVILLWLYRMFKGKS